MHVALLYPEVLDLGRFKEKRKEFPPFGVLYLAAVLEKAGHVAKIFKVGPDKILHDLRDFDAIAFSVPSSATYGMMLKARKHSLIAPGALVLVGGVHPSFYPERTFRDWDVHAVGIDEGEETLLELLEHAKDKDLSNVAGICHSKEGKVVRTAVRANTPEVDELPLPARHLLDEDDFIMSDRLSDTDVKMAHVMFSRGCPFPCRFCAAAHTKIQYRSGRSARIELADLKERYNIGGFAIVDDNFVVNRKKVIDVCSSIEDLGLHWSALSRIDTVDSEVLLAMKKSGCLEVKFGIESGSQRMLNSMRKNTTLADIRRGLVLATEAGIRCKVFIIHGFPSENLESTLETVSLLKEVKGMIHRASLFRFVPLPGTAVYNEPLTYKLRGTDSQDDWDGDWSKYHIHHNNHHWWGSEKDFKVLNESYEILNEFVNQTWPDRHLVL